MLTYFQHSFTDRLSRKFVIKSYLNMLPHLKRVATLPCEISVQKIPQERTLYGYFTIPCLLVFFYKKHPLEKDLQGFLKLCGGFWIIEL